MSRILHVCLSNFYVDGYGYQENELIRQHVSENHDVLVLASTETISKEGKLVYVAPSEYLGNEGARIKRIPYRRWLPHKVMRKLRMHPKVYYEIERFSPEIILFHGTCGWELRAVTRFARRHPKLKFFIDSHEDANNSAKGFVSRELLHKRYYGPILRSAIGAAEPILCISLETIDFVRSTYRIPSQKLEFFPLGGHPLPDEDYTRRRAEWRQKLGLDERHVMFLQTGKFTRAKRLLASLRAFTAIRDPAFRLFLSGVLTSDDRDEIRDLIDSDARIHFLGWNDAEDLRSLMAASDIYLQPGSQSVSMQNSMCQRCALIIDNVKSHQPFMDGNGYFTQAGRDLDRIFTSISADKGSLPRMQARSYEIALAKLDYAKLASRITSDTAPPAAGDDRPSNPKAHIA